MYSQNVWWCGSISPKTALIFPNNFLNIINNYRSKSYTSLVYGDSVVTFLREGKSAIICHLTGVFFISSSSCRAISTDIPDTFTPLLPIVSCFRPVFRSTSRINRELYVVSIWSSCLCSSMWSGPQKYITYEVIPTSPAVSCLSGSSNFDSLRDGWLVAVQLLLCGVLSSGLVQYCLQYSCVVVVKLFLPKVSYHQCSASIY